MRIEIVSDVICPWCFIGKRRLEKALAQRPDLDFEIGWRPFQLNPDMPKEGADRKSYLEAKFGGPERAKEIYARVTAEGAKEGIPFDFDGIKRTPNTLAAHSVLRWALSTGAQTELKERLFRLYFLEGQDIGNHQVLADAAEAEGMDGALVKRLLDEGHDADVIQAEDQMARQLGITGVPFFIFERRYGVPGAQDPEVLLQVIDRVAEESATNVSQP
ncbi:DsbA family oxidoreductase [uncultured Ferrovibrio sp.]|jgi:predicted DsbA family dithiol-disulfide isomerase|uniref:DsbA family oxidoreductase n=1 Tax=uncultured Ferrovibrio sp. TaxID=1576913 RepID=UPI00261F9832|nr:DsbA family oxidoreductase [uncultured Ferrovibrio sp.]